MSVSTEVQRTLVKSPPELWSELSNPEALSRHLADIGEIRITAVEPETKVEWEAKGASGVVHLKQAGWGTRVTLSVTRATPTDDEPSEPEPVAKEPSKPEPSAEEPSKPEPIAEKPSKPEPAATVGPEPVIQSQQTPEPEPTPSVEPGPPPGTIVEPLLAEPQSEPKQGLFARLFRRRKKRAPEEAVETQPEPAATMERERKPEIEIVGLAAPEPIYPEPPPEPVADLGAELASVEAQMEQETAELLTGVLDRLGAAHHRPFSRG
ncbi:MAG TPA: hypothetical protein VNX67_06940 [Solirubrobacteraceae bacterium]|jgi:hypothetical protein|nr:hypothetical protein [Solirubrobacteraceae bacterium]